MGKRAWAALGLPSIGAQLHAPVAGLQWVVAAYTVVLASLLMLAGALADRFGRKAVFQAGLCLFTLGSWLCSLAPGLAWLVAFRALQGAGASMLNPAALGIISPARSPGRPSGRRRWACGTPPSACRWPWGRWPAAGWRRRRAGGLSSGRTSRWGLRPSA
jgi:MFS family permease